MSEKTQNNQSNPLILQSVYPDAAAIFAFEPEPIKVVIANCLVVLDTNVLLVPYNTGRDSLEQIRKTYAALAKQNRLIVPGQVAREFAQNRSEKLKTVFQQVSIKSNISITRQVYPLLESVPEYQEVVRMEEQIDSQLREYRTAVGHLKAAISNWYWNDPVSTLYREVFTPEVICDPSVNEQELLKELEIRQIHRIPPGYKDANKLDGGVGDLLIWNTILELGKKHNMHIVFVSGEEKADWWHQSEKKALFPRFELIDEFRRKSNGKSVYIISFSDLLEFFGASSDVIQEVRQEEAIVGLETSSSVHAARMASAVEAEQAVLLWLMQRYPASRIKTNYRNFPDFLVQEATGLTGYEVKFIQSRENVFRRFREMEDRLSVRADASQAARIYGVFVAGTPETLEALARVISHRRPRNPMLGLILGIVDTDGTFREQFRQAPPGESMAL